MSLVAATADRGSTQKERLSLFGPYSTTIYRATLEVFYD